MTSARGSDCEEAVRQLAAYLDRELDSAAVRELERHLETCRSCFSRAEFERRLRERMKRDLNADPVPPEFSDRIRMLVRSLPQDD